MIRRSVETHPVYPISRPSLFRTSIIMASGRELSYVLLCGILASYTCTFIILAEPSFLNCTREGHSHKE